MPKIIALALVLCLIGVSAPWAQEQQNPAQQADIRAAMTAQAENIIADAAQASGLLTSFGNPAWVMDTGKNRADVIVEFQHGPLPDLAAAEFGMIACARLAQNYVAAKAPVRRLGLTVTSPLPDGRMRVYGTAIYNGNLAALIWENAGLNLDTAAAPKVPANAKARAASEKPVIGQAQNGQAAANARPKANQPVEEEIIEEEVVVIQPQTPQQDQAAQQQKATPKQKQIQQYPNDVTPGAIRPKQKKSQESPCPYVQGLANPESRPMPPALGMTPPRGPQTGCPYLDGKIPDMAPQATPQRGCPYLQGKMPGMVPAPKPGPQVKCPYLQGIYNKQKKAPDNGANSAININPSEQSFEVVAQNILNATAAELGIQDIFGNPAYTLEATDKQANMMAQFRQGPLPEEAAMAYGLSACENLARAYVVKGLGTRKLALTVTCLLPNGGMNIYGTAVFNGNLEDIKWQNAGLVVNPGPGQPPVPPLPYVNRQQYSPDGQAVQRRPLNVQRAPQSLKPSPAKTQNQANNAAPNAAQQPAEKAVPQQQGQVQEQQKQPKASEQQTPQQQKQAPEKQPAKKSLKEQALDNANEANQATYSFEARQIINHAVRAIGLQSTYGMPEYSVIAGDKKADIYIIFKRGPMPDASAASFGLMACEQLARACIIKGLETRYLGVTVCYVMPDGRRYDYGTAIFNGNLDNLSWVVVDRII